MTLDSASCAVPASEEFRPSTRRCAVSVFLTTIAVKHRNTATSTISTSPRRQFRNSVIGSSTTADRMVESWSRKNTSQVAEQPVGAGQHRLDQAPGMGSAMKRQRQIQHVAEVAAHRLDTMPMRQPLGLQGDRDVADDAADADGDPDSQQDRGLVPHLARAASCPTATAGSPPGRTAPDRETASPQPSDWRKPESPRSGCRGQEGRARGHKFLKNRICLSPGDLRLRLRSRAKHAMPGVA